MGRLSDALSWLPHYYAGRIRRAWEPKTPAPDGRTHVFFTICDHYEPYWGKVDAAAAHGRISEWLDRYPKIADENRDDDGKALPYSFFFPEEEYRRGDMDRLASLCAMGLGEVEIHLHHDNDTSENLRRTLLDFKRRLREYHGLLGTDSRTGEIAYGFIHGNWALDNSRPDGRWCGVNDELTILQETGCYADFTMPSAPSDTQTRKVNSIYYAVGDPLRRKAHDSGKDARAGRHGQGLLLVQGPLLPAHWNRKFGILPRIENGSLQPGMGLREERAEAWLDAQIGVRGASGYRFVKLYAHGAQDDAIEYSLQANGLAQLLQTMKRVCSRRGYLLHYLSAREMANAVFSLEGSTGIESHGGILPPPILKPPTP